MRHILQIGENRSIQRNQTRRSRIELVACILRKTKTPTRKTQLMYSCNLSYKVTDDLLDFLHLNDLVEKTDSTAYQTTEKGHVFLNHYERLSQLARITRDQLPTDRSLLQPDKLFQSCQPNTRALVKLMEEATEQ